MKILLSARRFEPPYTGGVDVYTDRLGKALARLGHEIVYVGYDGEITLPENRIRRAFEHRADRRTWKFEFDFKQRPQLAFHHGYDEEMARVFGELLDEEQPDLAILLNFYMVTLAAADAAAARGIPVVHIATDFLPICRRATYMRWDGSSCQTGESLRSCASCFVSERRVGRLAARALEKFPEDSLMRWARRPPGFANVALNLLEPYFRQVRIMDERLDHMEKLRNQIDLVLAPTRFTAQAFISNGFSAERVHLLPFGVEPDSPMSQVAHAPSEHVRFLFVGRLQPYKGADILVDAFSALERPQGATLTLYGSFDGYERYFAQLKERIERNPAIEFKGRIPPEDLHQAFADADYFILPSTWHENSPLILLDALQSRTPVIASDIGGVRDIVQHGRNGLLFPMGERRALRELLQQTIDEPALLARLQGGSPLPSIDDYTKKLLQLAGRSAPQTATAR